MGSYRGPIAVLSNEEILALLQVLPLHHPDPPPGLITAMDKLKTAMEYDSRFHRPAA